MKNIYSLLLLAITNFAFSQTTIYSENFGAGDGSNNPVVTSYSGYQSTSTTYSGTADIRITTPSTGYTGASGNGCVFLGAVTTTNGLPEKNIIISGINTTNYSDLILTLGQQKSTNASSNELKIDVSSDGINYTNLSYTRSTGNSNWELITPSGAIPSTSNLRIKIYNPRDSNVGFRIDDVKLTGNQTLAVSNSKKEKFNIYPTVVTTGIICVTSATNQTKKVTIYDSTAKLVISRGTDKEVNVSQLPSGTYVMNVEENGVVESKKFIVK
ncbi:T9SS type A sorting domain-containing protein [Epilithonimonas zeae]|uniref:T9SS type A sorting domain-containing protein n=1 Tax=Epilithonimonas zeae TaxID=1416779 RepID=UPI00200FDCDF|nr:T9SS type A sorting domain-containing protein [Epilithonimonas zeae]UQB67804.1 T9SS type A sorting domain-containing protein [Epilithonimonas zeae]